MDMHYVYHCMKSAKVMSGWSESEKKSFSEADPCSMNEEDTEKYSEIMNGLLGMLFGGKAFAYVLVNEGQVFVSGMGGEGPAEIIMKGAVAVLSDNTRSEAMSMIERLVEAADLARGSDKFGLN